MPVSDSDLQCFYSTASGSTGGAIAGSSPTSGVKNNVVPDKTSAERLAGGTDYRKLFFKNNHGTDDMVVPVLYTPVLPTNATFQLGLGVNNSSDDDAAQGNMTAWSAGAKVALISDGTDTRNVDIYGLVGSTPTKETVTLTSASEVLSVATFAAVYGVIPASTSGTRTISVKQGTGGTIRGTIGPNKKICWLWVTAGTAKSSGIALPNLPAGQTYGCWQKLSWSAAVGAVKPNTQTIRFEEN